MTHRSSHLLVILLLTSLILLPAAYAVAVRTNNLQAKFLPPEDKVLLIVGQDREAIQNYIKKVGVLPAGFTFYTSIQKLDGLREKADYGGGVQHASYLLKRYPVEVVQIGLYMVGALDGVKNGNFDENIDQLGKWIKDSRKLVFLRIGYEFDNPGNHYDPTEYVAAYHHIVDRLRELRVKNVAFVWHSYASERKHSLEKWYPGDDYVDWMAITYFNPYNTDNMDKVVDYARSKNKPMMIAEAAPIKMGSTEGEALWKRWYAFVFDYIKTRNIKAFCYINCNWDNLPMFTKEQWGDSRIEADKTVRSRWIETIEDGRFINHSPDLRDFALESKLNL